MKATENETEVKDGETATACPVAFSKYKGFNQDLSSNLPEFVSLVQSLRFLNAQTRTIYKNTLAQMHKSRAKNTCTPGCCSACIYIYESVKVLFRSTASFSCHSFLVFNLLACCRTCLLAILIFSVFSASLSSSRCFSDFLKTFSAAWAEYQNTSSLIHFTH